MSRGWWFEPGHASSCAIWDDPDGEPESCDRGCEDPFDTADPDAAHDARVSDDLRREAS